MSRIYGLIPIREFTRMYDFSFMSKHANIFFFFILIHQLCWRQWFSFFYLKVRYHLVGVTSRRLGHLSCIALVLVSSSLNSPVTVQYVSSYHFLVI